MSTLVRYYARAKIVYMRGRGVTTTFRVSDRGQVNSMLDWLGYEHVTTWKDDDRYSEGQTTRRQTHVPKIPRVA